MSPTPLFLEFITFMVKNYYIYLGGHVITFVIKFITFVVGLVITFMVKSYYIYGLHYTYGYYYIYGLM